jgi:hypothetical protein
MSNTSRYLPAALLAAAVLVSSPACATGGYYPQQYPVGDRDDRAFFNRGFNEGRTIGIEDARRGRVFDVSAHREWRDIERQRIERDDARAYRTGFEQGYRQGYREFERRDVRPAYPPPPPYVGERGGYVSPATDHGYRDGLAQGRHDGQKGERFDPERSRQYRSADHEYDRRYGSIDLYQRDYRDAFRRGYEQGYREFRR